MLMLAVLTVAPLWFYLVEYYKKVQQVDKIVPSPINAAIQSWSL